MTIIKGHPNLVNMQLYRICWDCCNTNSQCSCFHPLGSIIYSHKNIFVSYISSSWLNWPTKSNAHFKNYSYKRPITNFAKLELLILLFVDMHHKICNNRAHLYTQLAIISNIQYFSLCYFSCKMPS